MNTYTIDKQTAKDICAVRRAQHNIDKIELSQTEDYRFWRGGFKPPDSPDIAYLKNGTMLPPFRCDIVAKWAAVAEKQQGACPDTTIRFTVADNGEVTLACGQSSVRLYAIDWRNEPPIHPLPIIFDGDKIKLDFDPKEITDKAKLLTSSAAKARTTAKVTAKDKADAAKLAEYERCKIIVTPEAVARCVKRVKRLRKLAAWARKVDKALDEVPSLPALIANPLFNAFDSQHSEAYGDARLRYLEATRKRDNFKPRSWRSSGLEKHNENVKIARAGVRGCVESALDHHVRATGFSCYNFSPSDNENDVRRCRKYIRQYESTKEQT